jgi:hypothetical protein
MGRLECCTAEGGYFQPASNTAEQRNFRLQRKSRPQSVFVARHGSSKISSFRTVFQFWCKSYIYFVFILWYWLFSILQVVFLSSNRPIRAPLQYWVIWKCQNIKGGYRCLWPLSYFWHPCVSEYWNISLRVAVQNSPSAADTLLLPTPQEFH